MVCPPCKDDRHKDCPGGTWCDCQHLPYKMPTDSSLGNPHDC